MPLTGEDPILTNTTNIKNIIIYVIILLLFFITLPIYLTTHVEHASFRLLALFYLTNIFIAFYYLRSNSIKIYNLKLQSQNLQEKINILKDQNSRELKAKITLQQKIARYNNLKKIIEEINQNLNMDSIADYLVEVTFSLIADNKGVCVLYLVDSQNQSLALFKTKKEDRKLIIKAKEGDIFDLWILRHARALLVEDISKDFRFDLEKLKTQEEYTRPVSSLIGAPLISDHRFLGILRLDNETTDFYSQDDLRFLVTICDTGAVALENAELFVKTQDLAIHDGLTSLYRKGYFLERLKEEYKRSIRQDAPLSLLMLDIDNFKNYNDKFGHTAGDIVLRTLSQNIVDFSKDVNPVIGRFGGEEFCIILPHRGKEEARTFAERLRQSIESIKIILRRQQTHITVSIGVATFPIDARDEDGLILKSDKAMYKAKQKGRNQVISA